MARLLKAAMKLFAKHGYHGTSISEIAKEAKVSKGLTYHYFESKEALLVVLAEQRLMECAPFVHGLETIQDPMERLRFLVGAALDDLKENTEKLRFFNSIYLTNEGVSAIEKAMQKYKDKFERVFAAERKLFSDLGFPDPDLEATFLRSTLQGISLEYMLGPKDYPLEQMKEKLIVRYLKK